jgi:hypothetical protein
MWAARQRRTRPTQDREEGQLGVLTQAQVQRYANESGLRDIMIAEKEVVLTFLLQLFSESGVLDRLAFNRHDGGIRTLQLLPLASREASFAPATSFNRRSRPLTQFWRAECWNWGTFCSAMLPFVRVPFVG